MIGVLPAINIAFQTPIPSTDVGAMIPIRLALGKVSTIVESHSPWTAAKSSSTGVSPAAS